MSEDQSGDASQFEVGSLVAEHLKKIQEIAGGRECIYRGQSNARWPLESGAARRIIQSIKVKGNDSTDIVYAPSDAIHHYHEDLLKKAREKGFGFRDGRPLSDLELLAELQHFGAATCLLDFTTDPLVALYFALGEGSEDARTDGKIFIYPIFGHSFVVDQSFADDEHAKKIGEIISRDNPTLWRPIVHGEAERRIIRQSGVFAFNLSDRTPSMETHFISRNEKESLRKELKEFFGISAQNLFIDLAGFAQNNNYREKIVNHFTEYYRGINLFNNREYAAAIVKFSKAINLKQDCQEAHFLRASAQHFNGNLEDAITSYSELLNLEPPNSPQILLSRADVRIESEDIIGAIDDYSAAIHLGLRTVEVFTKRARARVQIGDIAGARADFEEALSLARTQNQPEETLIEIQEELDALGSEDDPPNTPKTDS